MKENSATAKHEIPASSLSHLLSGRNDAKATFTVVSKKTGKDYTFKVKRAEFKLEMYTHVSVEINYLDFLRLGHYRNGEVIHKGKVTDTASSKAISWLLRQVENKNWELLEKSVTILHLGACMRCGKVLTDADSINSGFGPHCRTRV